MGNLWVFQPSTGHCWLGKSDLFIPVPALDRIAGSIPKHEIDLFELLTDMHPHGLGVLLGVGKGNFAKELLSKWNGGVYLVDPYIYTIPSNSADDINQQLIYENLRRELHMQFENRFVNVRDFSYSLRPIWTEKKMPNPSFIYIDNNHNVTNDILTWWDILAPGGIIAGTQYIKHSRAVDYVFKTKFKLPLNIIPTIQNGTWFAIKPLPSSSKI